MAQLNPAPAALFTEDWADRIRTQVGRTVAAIIALGQLLIDAKAALPHGEWGRMFDDGLVPFGVRSAQMLMAIAEHPELSNAKHVSLLPPSWGTLYELTKVEPKRLAAAIHDGTVTADMERRAVAALISGRDNVSTSKQKIGASCSAPSSEPIPLAPPPPSTYEWVDNQLTASAKVLDGALNMIDGVLKKYAELDAVEKLTAAERRTIRARLTNARRSIDLAIIQFGGK